MTALSGPAASRARHPSARKALPTGVVLIAPSVAERDRSYAVAMIRRLRRLATVPADRVTVVLRWSNDTEIARPARVLVRFEGGAARVAHHAAGHTFAEALDRIESAVRRAVA